MHLYPDCPGTKAYGSGGPVRKVHLKDRICAARSGCAKCFGEFFGESSRRDLVRLINRLHGAIDEDQPARKVIAAKARLRFGDAPTATAGAPGRGRITSVGTSKGAEESSGVTREARKKPKQTTPGSRSPRSMVSKAEAKRERDRLAAAKLGITVEQLKEQRRAKHQENVMRKQARRKQ